MALSTALKYAYERTMFALRQIVPGLLITPFLIVVAGAAWAQSCPTPKDAAVNLRLLDPAPKLSTTKNLKQINSKAKAHGLLRQGSLVLGLTQSEIQTAMNIRFQGYQQGGLTCLNVSQIDVSFGHRKLNILLPRDYARGTCQYKTVLKHEKEHVRVNREGVRKYGALLKRELERAQKKLNPMSVRDMKQGQVHVQRVLQQVVNKVTMQFNKDITAKHAAIDTPGSPYDATGACHSW